MEDYSDYILDLERLNELSTHPNDGQKDSGFGPNIVLSLSKSFLKMSLKTYESQFSRRYVQNENDEKIFKILHYNKVIIGPHEIRDENIDKIID